MGYSIGGVADKLDLSPHTLRYYEKEGLIPPVSRAGNGRRVYSKEDLNWIQMVQCLRKTGMSVALIKEYIELESADGDSFEQQRALVLRQRKMIENKIAEMNALLDIIDSKVRYFEN